MKKGFLFCILWVSMLLNVKAAIPKPALVGYWHNWHQTSIPFIKLKDIDSRYNVVNLSFFAASGGNVSNLSFNMYNTVGYTNNDLINDIKTLQGQGKVVNISIGGANGSFRLKSEAEKDVFVTKVKSFIQTFGVDGIDIDLEQKTYVCMNGGTIQAPTDVHVVQMISGIKELLSWYQTTYNKKMVLTMAPETVYVEGALSNWAVNNACGGSYLPIIETLRSDIDLLMVQLYNSGGMFDLNYVERNQGTADFIVSQTEAIIRGFNSAGGLGPFSGMPASKVCVALPSCGGAGNGAVSDAVAKSAMNYLLGVGTKPGTYTLKQSGGYPDLGGMMTWSINNDALASCGSGAYAFAANFKTIYDGLGSFTAPQVTFNDVTKKVGDPNFTMTAISTSPATITYSISSGAASASINSTTGEVTIKKAGTVTVKMEQSASGGYIYATRYATLTIEDVTNVESFEALQRNISVYPTVTTNNLTINSTDLSIADGQILNQLGEVVFVFELKNQQQVIDVASFASGNYFVKVLAEDKVFIVPFMKQ